MGLCLTAKGSLYGPSANLISTVAQMSYSQYILHNLVDGSLLVAISRTTRPQDGTLCPLLRVLVLRVDMA